MGLIKNGYPSLSMCRIAAHAAYGGNKPMPQWAFFEARYDKAYSQPLIRIIIMVTIYLFTQSQIKTHAATVHGMALFKQVVTIIISGGIDMRDKKKMGIIGIALTVIILVAVGVLLIWTSRPANVTITDNAIKVAGAYGVTVYFSDIEGITLVEESMREIGAGRRRNGADTGGNMRGNFDAGLLFVRNANEGPTIRIDRRNEASVFISLDESDETRDL